MKPRVLIIFLAALLLGSSASHSYSPTDTPDYAADFSEPRTVFDNDRC
jgi:hypothetical protein